MNFTHDPAEAIEGVLWRYQGGWLTLRDVSGLRSGQGQIKVHGEIVIHRAQIAFLQVLP